MRENTKNSGDYQRQQDTPKFEDLPQLMADLRADMADLKEAFKLIYQNYQPHSDFLDVEQLIEYIPGIKDKTGVYYLVKHKGLPAKKLGKKLYFDKTKVDEYLRNGEE